MTRYTLSLSGLNMSDRRLEDQLTINFYILTVKLRIAAASAARRGNGFAVFTCR